MESKGAKKNKTNNRMDKVHFTNAKLTTKCVLNIINLEKQMKIKMAILLREKQKVETEFKAQKKEKLRIKSEPRMKYKPEKEKGRRTVTKRRPVKSALRSPATTNLHQRHVSFTGTGNDSESDDQSDAEDDQSDDHTRPNLLFSGLTPSRRTQISMTEGSSSDEDADEDVEPARPPVLNAFRNAFSGRRESSFKDETGTPLKNASSLALSQSHPKINRQTRVAIPSAFPGQSTTTSLKAQAFQTEMRMVKPEDVISEQDEFPERFTRRRSRSAILSDVIKMRRQSPMGYRPPSAPSKNKNTGQYFTNVTGRQQSVSTEASSSDWNRQTREKLNDPWKAYRLPSLVVDESETRAFFVQLNSLRQEKKKVKENETLLFLRKVDQTRENEELNCRLHKYFSKTKTDSSKCDIDINDVIDEDEEKMIFQRVRGLRSYIQT